MLDATMAVCMEKLFDTTVIIVYNATNFFMHNKYFVHLNSFFYEQNFTMNE